MHDETSLIRRLVLLRTLEARRHGVCLKEMAHEMRVTERTIRRDFDLLRVLGFRLVEEEHGEHRQKVYRLAESARMPPLIFNWDEAAVLYLARQFLEPLTGTAFWHAADRAMQKIRATLNERSLDYLSRFPRLFHWTKWGVANYAAKAGIIDALMVAIEDCAATTIRYQSQDDDEPTQRRIHPYAFRRHTKNGALYLVAFAPEHGAVRHYKVNRVEDVQVGTVKFQRPADFDADRDLAGSFGVYDGDDDVTVVVEFKKPAARYVAETPWHASQKLEDGPDGRLRATFRLSSTVEVKSWVLGFGANAVVLEPESLRSEIAAELARLLDEYTRKDDQP